MVAGLSAKSKIKLKIKDRELSIYGDSSFFY